MRFIPFSCIDKVNRGWSVVFVLSTVSSLPPSLFRVSSSTLIGEVYFRVSFQSTRNGASYLTERCPRMDTRRDCWKLGSALRGCGYRFHSDLNLNEEAVAHSGGNELARIRLLMVSISRFPRLPSPISATARTAAGGYPLHLFFKWEPASM